MLPDMNTSIDRWQKQIGRIKQELLELGEMRPGALSKQFNVCGKKGCRCKDQQNPKKHGPYYQVSYTHLGKSSTEFVRKEVLQEVRMQLANYAKFKRLTQDWVKLSLQIAAARRKSR
jgi:hypothetical protein